jgi:hypothetical protein
VEWIEVWGISGLVIVAFWWVLYFVWWRDRTEMCPFLNLAVLSKRGTGEFRRTVDCD